MKLVVKILAFEWSMVASTLCLVLLRLYHRSRHAHLAWFEDGFVVIAWACFLSQVSMDTKLNSRGFFNVDLNTLASDINGEIADETSLKIFYVENATYYWCMYAVKAAMLCFYTRLIPGSMIKTRVSLWVTVITAVIGFVITTMLNLFLCIPISRNWDPEGDCSSGWTSVAGSIVPYVFHLLTDVMIYVLPFSVVRVLPLPKPQKIGVAITFALGLLCIVFAVAYIVVGYLSSSATTNWIVAVFEQTWCICVACAPALKGLTNGDDFRRWRNRVSLRREKRPDDESQIGPSPRIPGGRLDSDATVTVLSDVVRPLSTSDHPPQSRKSPSQVDTISVMSDEKYTPSPHTRKTSNFSNAAPTVVPPSINRQSHDTEYHRSGTSSPGCTMSIASIIDFHDLERQLQLDDEKRQTKNCSPVLERRSSENIFSSSPSSLTYSSEKRATR